MRFWKYLWKPLNVRIQILLIFSIILTFTYFIVYSFCKSMGFAEMWQNWMEAFLAIATIILAFLIGYNEKRQDWENTLPKRLNACFDYNGEAIFTVENAPLAGTDDIRQWGQQIGKQMNNNQFLSFNGFRIEGPEILTDENKNYKMQYKLTVWLQEKPDEASKVWKYNDDGKLLV